MKNKKTIYKQTWEQYGAEKQIIVAMEECAELTKELSKLLRNKNNLMSVAEEMADVEIMIEQIKQHFAVSAVVAGFKVYKIKRLEKRLKTGE